MRARGVALALALLSSPLPALAQPVPDRRGTDEQLLLLLTATTYAFRTGTALNQLAGVHTFQSSDPLDWVMPISLAVAAPVATFFIERRFRLRRGRALTAGVGAATGYFLALNISTLVRGESFPSGETLAGLPTWIGTTAGLGAGILIGHLTDSTPAAALYAGTGSLGGLLLGLVSCGVIDCGDRFGAVTLGAQLAGLTLALTTYSVLRPTQRELRWLPVGAVVGLLPAAGVLSAYWARDGAIHRDALERASVMALAGGVLGGAAAWWIARHTSLPTPTVVPTVMAVDHGLAIGITSL